MATVNPETNEADASAGGATEHAARGKRQSSFNADRDHFNSFIGDGEEKKLAEQAQSQFLYREAARLFSIPRIALFMAFAYVVEQVGALAMLGLGHAGMAFMNAIGIRSVTCCRQLESALAPSSRASPRCVRDASAPSKRVSKLARRYPPLLRPRPR